MQVLPLGSECECGAVGRAVDRFQHCCACFHFKIEKLSKSDHLFRLVWANLPTELLETLTINLVPGTGIRTHDPPPITKVDLGSFPVQILYTHDT